MEEQRLREEVEKKEKKSKLDIDNDFDFAFTKTLNPILRWILVLPIGMLSLLAVQMVLGFILTKLIETFSIEIVRSICIALLTLVKFLVFVMAMVATAPVARNKKVITSIILSVFPIAVLGFTASVYLDQMGGVDGDIWAQLVGGAIGIAFAIYTVWSTVNKPKDECESVAA